MGSPTVEAVASSGGRVLTLTALAALGLLFGVLLFSRNKRDASRPILSALPMSNVAGRLFIAQSSNQRFVACR
jgi:hypothetical protein